MLLHIYDRVLFLKQRFFSMHDKSCVDFTIWCRFKAYSQSCSQTILKRNAKKKGGAWKIYMYNYSPCENYIWEDISNKCVRHTRVCVYVFVCVLCTHDYVAANATVYDIFTNARGNPFA